MRNGDGQEAHAAAGDAVEQGAAGKPACTSCRPFVLPPEGIVLEDVERDLLVQALDRCHGNRTRAARLLGLNRDQVRYRIHKFGLERMSPEPEEESKGTERGQGPA